MASLRDIRRRITSVEKTQQITSAMRMVAAAKLRRAQDAIEAARPYAERMRATLEEVARSQRDQVHPLLEERERVRRLEVVVVCSDRGLCGAFNANVLKSMERWVEEGGARADEVVYTAIGRKSLEFLKRRRRTLRGTYVGLGTVAYGHAQEIASQVGRRFVEGEADEVMLVYSEFVSALTQTPRSVRLLPFATGETGASETAPYAIEPSPEQLMAVLVPKALEVEVYRALLENQAGEHAARMTAMESATRNTEEMIDRLTLTYNRARQAAITKELVEIVSGAEAL